MKHFFFIILIINSFVVFAQNQAINVVIDDVSWQKKEKPIGLASEQDRIQAHLNYVIETIEDSSVTYPDSIVSKRVQMIHLLREYVDVGVFPKNTAYPNERRPCFIDDSGNICAVGYLVQETVGRETAEYINDKFQYAFLKDIKDSSLLMWQQNSGLTTRELAMIQPTYGMPLPNDSRAVFFNKTKKKYGIKDQKGRVKVRAKYDQIVLVEPSIRFPDFKGVEFARLGSKWGIINGNGKKIHDFKFDTLALIPSQPWNLLILESSIPNEFIHGFTDTSMMIFNARAELLENIPLDEVKEFYYPLLEMKSKGLWGVLNKDGTWCISPLYDSIAPLSTRKNLSPRYGAHPCRFIVGKNGQYGFVENNEVKIPLLYDSLSDEHYGFLGKKGDQFFLFDKAGNLSEHEALDGLPKELNNHISWYGDLIIQKKGKFRLIDDSLRYIDPYEYDEIRSLNNSYLVKKNGLYGLYDLDHRQLLAPEYDSIQNFYPYFLVEKDHKQGMLGWDGEFFLQVEWDSIIKIQRSHKYYQECFAVRMQNQWEIYIIEGGTKKKIEGTFDLVLPVQLSEFVVQKGTKVYVAAISEGGLTFKNEEPFQNAHVLNSRLIAYRKGSKYGLWNCGSDYQLRKGKLTEPIYDEILEIDFYRRKKFLAQKEGKYGLIMEDGRFYGQPHTQSYHEAYFDDYLDTTSAKSNKEGEVLFFRKGEDWYKVDLKAERVIYNKLYGEEKKRIELLDSK